MSDDLRCPDCDSPNLEENVTGADFECRDCGWWGDKDEVGLGPKPLTPASAAPQPRKGDG